MTLALAVLMPFAGALLPLLVGPGSRPRRRAAISAAIPAAISLGLVLARAPRVFAGEVLEWSLPWMPALGLQATFRMDGYAWMFATLVFGIGLLIVLYARYYLSRQDAAARFFALLLLFMGSMAGIVLSGNLILLLVFWELTSLSSFLLIGYWFQQPGSRFGARLALAVTGLGGLAMLAGFLLLGRMAGSFELSQVLAAREQIVSDPLFVPMLVLVLVGAFTKSAQVPFQLWLPRAMAAPTPVSAYLHSATMVKAGVFLLGRLFPVLADTDPWFLIVTTVGLVTMLVGAYAAVFAHDLKGLLAYSTISHLGLITMLFGFGTADAAIAAVFHIMNHATFKASLFMAAGIIDHEAGSRDMRVLNGLWRYMPVTATLAIVASAAMAGVPLLNGFLSKEMFFAEALGVGRTGGFHWIGPVGAVLAGILSVTYSARFISIFFVGRGTGMPKTPHEPPRFMRVPVEALAVACLAVGLFPNLTVAPTLEVAAAGVLNQSPPFHRLAIWHGFNLPLAMSAVALAGGVALYFSRRHLYRLHARYAPGVIAERIWVGAYMALRRGGRAVTAALETGSLQRYVLLLVVTALFAGAMPAVRNGWSPGSVSPLPVDWITLVGWGVLLVGALATAVLHRRRLTALVAISVVGLMVALAFVRVSAPDLALTQLLVEIVTIMLVLLVLGFLPRELPPDSTRARRWRDGLVAGLAGAGTAGLCWAVLTRPADSISWFFVEQSQPAGGGTNIVNVILVDFRAFDTLGEITVLGIAALGVIVLLHQVRLGETPGYGLPASDVAPVILTMITRALLPLALLFALFLFLRGHNLPGGGFIAGLLAAVALILQAVASGLGWFRQRVRAELEPLVALGVLIAALTGVGAWAFGAPLLTATFGHFHLPVVGDVELATAVLFDLGVFVTVVGSVLLVLVRLGGLPAPAPAEDEFRKEASPWKP